MASVESVFWSRVDRSGGEDACWPWIRGRDSGGYGMFSLPGGGTHIRAHRLAYEFAVGPIPDGATIDHLCRNRPCANPRHLEPVSRGENVRRGGVYRRKDTCIRGHDLAVNRTPYGCRACHNAQSLAKYHATKELKGRKRTVCRKGHPLEAENLRVLPSGQRQCITCARARSLRWWRSKQ